jgi:hypothetical protein
MYMFSPPRWSAGADRAALAASAVVAFALIALLVQVLRRCRPAWVPLLVVGAALVVGVGWGFFARVLTIGAYGANMSALILPLGPILLVLQAGLATAAGLLAFPLGARPSARTPVMSTG